MYNILENTLPLKITSKLVTCKISGSHGGAHENPSRLVRYTMLTGKELTSVLKRQYRFHFQVQMAEDKSTIILQNITDHLLKDTASHP